MGIEFNAAYLQELEEYLKSGALDRDFCGATDEERLEILGFLDRLMDVADLADEAATRLIFRDTPLGAMAGLQPGGEGC